MKRFFNLAIATIMIASATSLQAENKKNTPVYDPMTWKADTIQGVAGYVVPNTQANKGKKNKKQPTTCFLPMKNINTGEILGKLQPVSISDYSRGWTYIETAPANTSMADRNQPTELKDEH